MCGMATSRSRCPAVGVGRSGDRRARSSGTVVRARARAVEESMASRDLIADRLWRAIPLEREAAPISAIAEAAGVNGWTARSMIASWLRQGAVRRWPAAPGVRTYLYWRVADERPPTGRRKRHGDK